MVNEKKKAMPINCPSCGQILKAARLHCDNCKTIVEGNFEIPMLARLNLDDQQFIVLFLKSSGSLKDLARMYNLSYPTIRNRLDLIIEKIKNVENKMHEEIENGNRE